MHSRYLLSLNSDPIQLRALALCVWYLWDFIQNYCVNAHHQNRPRRLTSPAHLTSHGQRNRQYQRGGGVTQDSPRSNALPLPSAAECSCQSQGRGRCVAEGDIPTRGSTSRVREEQQCCGRGEGGRGGGGILSIFKSLNYLFTHKLVKLEGSIFTAVGQNIPPPQTNTNT